MNIDKDNDLTYGKNDEEWRNHVIDKLLSIKHAQWLQQHREAFLDYQDYLNDLNKTFGCLLIGYRFLNEGDAIVVKMMDNHHNLLKPREEHTTPPDFAYMRIRNATDDEVKRVSTFKSKPILEQSMYMAEKYFKQWVGEDDKLSPLVSVLLFFINTYIGVYQYRTLEIRSGGSGSKYTKFLIKMSSGQQTVELELDYTVIDQVYKDLVKRSSLAS